MENLKELNTILDSFEYELSDIEKSVRNIKEKISEIKTIINPKEEF